MPSTLNPFDSVKSQYEIDRIKKVLDPTNPYTMYNNTDRFLNVSYRLFTTTKLKAMLELRQLPPWGLPGSGMRLNTSRAALAGPEYQAKYKEFKQFNSLRNFEYEARTNVLSQYYWASTALLGFGASFNNSSLASASIDLYPLGALAVIRQGINAALESTLLIANGWRYGPKMAPPPNFGETSYALIYGGVLKTFKSVYPDNEVLIGSWRDGLRRVQGGLRIVNPVGWADAAVQASAGTKRYADAIRADDASTEFDALQHSTIVLRDKAADAADSFEEAQKKARMAAYRAEVAVSYATSSAKDAGSDATKGKSMAAVNRLKATAIEAQEEAVRRLTLAWSAAGEAATAGKVAKNTAANYLAAAMSDPASNFSIQVNAKNLAMTAADASEMSVTSANQTLAKKARSDVGLVAMKWDLRESERKIFRSRLGATVSAGFALNALIAVGMSGKMIQRASDKYYEEEEGGESRRAAAIASASLGLASALSNAFANTAKSLNSLATVRRFTDKTQNGLGWTGSAFGILNAVFGIASLAPSLFDKHLSSDEKGVIVAEMSAQVVGGADDGALELVAGAQCGKIGRVRHALPSLDRDGGGQSRGDDQSP